ncbi:DMT family transporter [Kiloniella sp. b19]|uniref:DMT family transporter n=1 Tax=Kiloniella sp. GXU_MW_B19 TaxID=3141326 RepID=UPI0031CF0BA4
MPSDLKAEKQHYVMLVALGLIWGSSFPLIKISLETIDALSGVVARLVLAAVFMTLFTLSRGLRLPRDPALWGKFSLLAMMGTLGPFVLIFWAQQYVDAALASILMGLVPLSSLVMAHLLTSDEKMSVPKLAGVLVGFAGVVVLIGPEALSGLGTNVIGQIAIALSAFSYGFNSVMARRTRVTDLNPFVSTSGVLICSALLSLPLLFIGGTELHTVSLRSGLAVTGLAVLGTCGAYILLYTLLRQVGAAFTSLNNYLVPLSGVGISVVFLGEQLNASALLAFCLIVGGIAISRMRIGRKAVTTE